MIPSCVRVITRAAQLTALSFVAACATTPPPPAAPAGQAGPSGAKVLAVPVVTKITAFAVSNENLNVDKVSLRDGLLKPDGNRDLVFTLTIDGPFEAIFVISTNAKGDPSYGLRADTLVGAEEIPSELGGVIDTGKMTVPMGVVEGGKFINGDSGAARSGPGIHNLTLYVPNTATLNAGSFVRAYVKVQGGTLVPGPVVPY